MLFFAFLTEEMRVLVLMITSKTCVKIFFMGALIPAGFFQILWENRQRSVGSLNLYDHGCATNSFFNVKICSCWLSELLPVEKTPNFFLTWPLFLQVAYDMLLTITYYRVPIIRRNIRLIISLLSGFHPV